MTKDNLTTCPKCKAEASCYTTPINEFHNAYSCLNCGFNTNDLMREGEFDFDQFESTLPELYKDIKKSDSKGRIWYPQAINILDKGTVFANGKNKDSWEWSAIKTIKLSNEE